MQAPFNQGIVQPMAPSLLIREDAPPPPYFLMQHVTISQPPEIGNFNLKSSPKFQLEGKSKRQKVEPKSATIAEHGDNIQPNLDNKKICSDDLKILIRRNHSMDRKVEENLDKQSNIQKASCSSSEANGNDDGSSNDSDGENDSKSSSSSSSSASNSSGDVDPMQDSKSNRANDCLNIIDSYESKEVQQQENNDL